MKSPGILEPPVREQDAMTLHDSSSVRRGLPQEAQRARRFEAHLSVLLINVDGLARINNTLGTEAGDYVLGEIGSLLRRNTRSIDVVGRWDRDDFIILTVDRNLEGSLAVAEKMRTLIREHPFAWQGTPVPVTVSIGIARGVPATEGQIDDLLARARQAVAQCKTAGGDRIERDVEAT